MSLFTKIHQALQGIIARFKNGDIPKAVAISTFPVPNIPAVKWSLFDRTLMFIADTGDAGGYRQWQAVGRYVQKEAKAFTVRPHALLKRQKKSQNEMVLKDVIKFSGYKICSTLLFKFDSASPQGI